MNPIQSIRDKETPGGNPKHEDGDEQSDLMIEIAIEDLKRK